MAVTSQPATHQRRKESAVTTRARLRRQRGAIERWSAWVVLLVSLVGTVVAFNGGWPNVLALKFSIAAVGGGFGLQALLTFLEWYYYDLPLIAWTARLIDTAMTAVGYGPLVVSPLAAYLLSKQAPGPLYVAWAIVALGSLVIAWYPESRLVD